VKKLQGKIAPQRGCPRIRPSAITPNAAKVATVLKCFKMLIIPSRFSTTFEA
jgi:hypothetical protein